MVENNIKLPPTLTISHRSNLSEIPDIMIWQDSPIPLQHKLHSKQTQPFWPGCPFASYHYSDISGWGCRFESGIRPSTTTAYLSNIPSFQSFEKFLTSWFGKIALAHSNISFLGGTAGFLPGCPVGVLPLIWYLRISFHTRPRISLRLHSAMSAVPVTWKTAEHNIGSPKL